ncbi:DUF4430 domain-containing protein [Methanochimaera problematica]|nr:PQQ-binding-like beta-propeller repeat protein [Methanoplanus sp. FWC-SCC4]
MTTPVLAESADYTGNVGITNGTTFTKDGIHFESQSSALSALNSLSKSLNFNYELNYTGDIPDIKSINGISVNITSGNRWNLIVNGNIVNTSPAGYECKKDDNIIFAYGPDGTDENNPVRFVNITVSDVRNYFKYEGDVELIQGTFSKDGIHFESNTSAFGALEILSIQESFPYTVTYSEWGAFIDPINGIGYNSDTGEYWNFLVNNNHMMTGASDYEANTGDTIVFAYGADGTDEINATALIKINVTNVEKFEGFEGSVQLTKGSIALVPDSEHPASNISALAALDAASKEGDFEYQVSYGGWGYQLDTIGNTGDSSQWIFLVNGQTARTGIQNYICKDGDKLSFYTGVWEEVTPGNWQPQSISESECIVNISVSVLPFKTWEGTVSLSDSGFEYHPLNNISNTYTVLENTDLGALKKASEQGFFSLNVSDSWYQDYGTFSLDGIADINSSAEQNNYWLIYINGEPVSSGLGGNKVVKDDVIKFCYGLCNYPEMVTPDTADKMVTIKVGSVIPGIDDPEKPQTGDGPSTANLKWTTTLPESPDTKPLIYNGKIYVSTWPDMDFGDGDEMYLYCLDADTGNEVWKNTLEDGYGSVAGAAIGGGNILVRGTNGKLYAVNLTSGTTEWIRTIDENPTPWSEVNSAPLVYKDRIFVTGQKSGILSIFDLKGNIQYSMNTGNSTYFSSPLGDGDNVYFACGGSKKLSCIDIYSYAWKWNVTVDDFIRSSPVLDDSNIYFTTKSGIYCINKDTGASLWNIAASPGSGTPAISGGSLFVGETDGLHCYDTSNGVENWHYESGSISGSPAVSDKTVYFATSEKAGKVIALDISTQNVIWSYTQTAPDDGNWASFYSSSPAIYNNRLYIGGEYYNKVYCFGAGDTVINNPDTGGKDSSDSSPSTSSVTYKSTLIGKGTLNVTAISGSEYLVKENTALGILIKSGYSYTVTDSAFEEYGSLFIDSIKGKKTTGTTGWMYQVNGISPGTGPNNYELKEGDEVLWYWSESMTDKPEDSYDKIGLKAAFSKSQTTDSKQQNENSGLGDESTESPGSTYSYNIGLPDSADLSLQESRTYLSLSLDAALNEGYNVKKDKNTISFSYGETTMEIKLEDYKEKDGQLFGPVESITLQTGQLESNNKNLGSFSVNINADLYAVPVDAKLTTLVYDDVSEDKLREFNYLLAGENQEIASVGAFVDVQKKNLEDGIDIGTSAIIFTVDKIWMQNKENADLIKIIHIKDNGETEILKTEFIGEDESGRYRFKAVSPDGLSGFALVWVKEVDENSISDKKGTYNKIADKIPEEIKTEKTNSSGISPLVLISVIIIVAGILFYTTKNRR